MNIKLNLDDWTLTDERKFQRRKRYLLKEALRQAQIAEDLSLYEEALVRAHYETYEFDRKESTIKWN